MQTRVETVETGSFAIDYLRFGRGGDTLVILPGASVQSVMGMADAIGQAYALLAESFTVYMLDYCRVLPDSCSVQDLADYAYEAICELGLNRVSIFGASLGGMVAQVLAIEHPALVKKLVLGCAAPQTSEEQYALFDRWATLAESGDTDELFRSFGQAVYPPDVYEQLPEQLTSAPSADELAHFAVLIRSAKGFNVVAQLDTIRCPVLAIGSYDDRIFGADGTLQIAAQLEDRPDFQKHLYDGYGHAVYDTAPDFKERMLRFLKGNGDEAL